MKKTLFLIVWSLCLNTAFFAGAQEQKTPQAEQESSVQGNKTAQEIALSSEQANSIQSNFEPSESNQSTKQSMLYWADKPAEAWGVETGSALPLGNGMIGAMIFGAVDVERIALNESTFWAGRPHRYDKPESYKRYPELKKLVADGKYKEAGELAEVLLTGSPVREMPYLPIGDWKLVFNYNDENSNKSLDNDKTQILTSENANKQSAAQNSTQNLVVPPEKSQFPGWATVDTVSETPYKNYRRDLDYETGLAEISYQVQDIEYRREMFVSYPDRVFVTRISADQPGKISFCSDFRSPFFDKQQCSALPSGETLQILDGRYRGLFQTNPFRKDNDNGSASTHEVEEGLRFQVRTVFIPKGGTVRCLNDGTVYIDQADEVLCLTSINTSFVDFEDISGNPEQRCEQALNAAPRNFKLLREHHIQDFQTLMSRVQLVLGDEKLSSIPTNVRLQKAHEGTPDPNLDALCFQFGRYLLASSSRKGGQPANLQGIWNQDVHPSWESNYTININTQMNYWPATVGNLPECHLPLFDMLSDLTISGARTAQSLYGVNGWCAHHNVDLWRDTAVCDAARYGTWIGGGGWLATHIWEHYAFTQDQEILKQYYPVLRESARFYLEMLEKDPQTGKLIIPVSSSPENTFLYDVNGKQESGFLATASLIDMSIVRLNLQEAIQASEILGEDEELRAQFKTALDNLLPFQINSKGELMEWGKSVNRNINGHTYSPCFAVFPGGLILPDKMPEITDAFLAWDKTRNQGKTAWPLVWDTLVAARLGNAKLTTLKLRAYVADSVASNMYNSVRNQADGTFGYTAAVAETLLQSHDDCLNFLPALSEDWRNGSVSGLCARGGWTVDLQWKDGVLVSAELFSKTGGKINVKYKEQMKMISVPAGVEVRLNKDLSNL